jgi:hypothetical protein
MTFYALRWIGTGLPGGRAYLTFRFQDVLGATLMNNAAAATRSFLNAVAPYWPLSSVFTPDPFFNEVQENDGRVTGVFSYSTVPAVVNGTGGQQYSSFAGACVIWRTSTMRVRRLAAGRTFLVPLAGAAYDNTGRITAAARTVLLNAAQTLSTYVAPGNPGCLTVWKRPTFKGATDGALAPVTGVQVNNVGAELKSRRT